MHRVIEEIIAANDWRDGEFGKFKAGANNIDEVLWCRMCLPMIYAHWEGFVASALQVMIGYLNNLQLAANQVPTKLAAHSLSSEFQSLTGNQTLERRATFLAEMIRKMNQTVKLEKRINTKSNLKMDVLKDLCSIYDFNFEKFSEIKSEINELVNVRNSIAHGENSYRLNMENINRYIISVKIGIDILTNEIAIYLENESYLVK